MSTCQRVNSQSRCFSGHPAETRVEMLELATAGHESFRVCRYEIDRGGISYTVDTLTHLQSEDPTRVLFLLLGADSLADLPGWREPERICQLATLIAVGRAGEAPPDWSAVAPLVSAERLAELAASCAEMPPIGINSTDLRRRVAAGQSIRYRTPRAVEVYIQTHGLYRAAPA